MVHKVKRGLNIPISGQPLQSIAPGPEILQVALIGDDYVGMRPTMLVNVGDVVSAGQPVFEDKKTPGVVYTSPCSGKVAAINRGARRKFESVVFDIEGDREESFTRYEEPGKVTREQARELLVKSGEWPALRTRPFSRVPDPSSTAQAIFVTAMDTNPLAAEPELIITNAKDFFIAGLQVLSKINDGPVYVCTRDDSRIPGGDIPGVSMEAFSGPHPAGLAGTHIHMLSPVGSNHTVWSIGYQDVIAWGRLFLTGKVSTERVVAVSGPSVKTPQLFTTRRGANIDQLVDGNLKSNDCRKVSGSVLCGRLSAEPTNFLGRFHLQVSCLEEGTHREFLGWQKPGLNKFSITRTYLGSLFPSKTFDMTTNINGGHRSMVPVGTYERVLPLDMMPTHLLRAMITEDTASSQQLGILELDEEDLALCTFVCPGKYDYGTILRENLTRIEKEG